jgi:hypothetical protein
VSTETQTPGLPPNWGYPVLLQIARINPRLINVLMAKISL